MDCHVEQRARGVFDRLEALVEAPRRLEPLDQILRNRLRRFRGAPRAAQHLGLERPVLEELGRQLDESLSTLVPERRS
jgi:hypothetical protein